MPLPPAGKTVWPPKAMEKPYRRYETLAAWWGGDPNVLASLYGSDRGGIDLQDQKWHASQFRDGAIGKVARWFWGTPPPAGELRTKLHLPLAGDIAKMSARLLFAEPPKVACEDEKAQERLDDITGEAFLQSTLMAGAEAAAALGDVYLVGTWDQTLRDWPWLRVVHADAVVPEWRWDVLTAATIWRVIPTDDKAVWRHLERHEPGRILHGLYRGDSSTLGVLMDLQDQDATKDLAPDGPTGIKQLTVAHIPNVTPNRLDRGSPLGMSDFSPGVLTLMDELDEVWSSLAREFRLARARGVATEDALRSLGPGKGAVIEQDREFFVQLNVDPRTVTDPVRLIQPLIRVDEHLAGARAITEQIIRACGYSLASFGESQQSGPGGAATAEEIRQRQSLSYLTRGAKSLDWARLPAALEMLLALDVAVFSTKVTPERPKVVFGDQIAESDSSTAQTLNLLTQSQSASIETRVKLLHPEWEESEVAEEVDRIKTEQGLTVPDPTVAIREPAPGQDPSGMPGTGEPTDQPAGMPAM